MGVEGVHNDVKGAVGRLCVEVDDLNGLRARSRSGFGVALWVRGGLCPLIEVAWDGVKCTVPLGLLVIWAFAMVAVVLLQGGGTGGRRGHVEVLALDGLEHEGAPAGKFFKLGPGRGYDNVGGIATGTLGCARVGLWGIVAGAGNRGGSRVVALWAGLSYHWGQLVGWCAGSRG